MSSANDSSDTVAMGSFVLTAIIIEVLETENLDEVTA
jgi:hypothetical protein